jgi:hypothetical protein
MADDQAQPINAARSQQVKPILFALGLNKDWGLYMPDLLRLAREHKAGIHVLETGAPLGTGSFTSNATQNTAAPIVPTEPEVLGDQQPVERRAGTDRPAPTPEVPSSMPIEDGSMVQLPTGGNPVNLSMSDPYPSALTQAESAPQSAAPQPTDQVLAWPDTVSATVQMNEFLGALVDYFKAAGLVATGDWQPDFDRQLLSEYADRIGAEVIAVPKRGFPANVLQNAYIEKLREDGFEVVLLEEVSEEELTELREHASSEASPKDASAKDVNAQDSVKANA